MTALLALLAFLQASHVPTEHVRTAGTDGTVLDAALVRPPGPVTGPGVVAMHGCGGPFPMRDGRWAVALAKAGHVVLLPDSFGSRSLGSQCRAKERAARVLPTRRADATAAARWLTAQPDTPAGGVVLMGLVERRLHHAVDSGRGAGPAARSVPPVRRVLLGCRSELRSASYRPSAPVMILVGANDDWTPSVSCQDLAAGFPAEVRLIVYSDAWHDFDASDRPVRVRSGLATPPSGTGQARTGTNEAVREDAFLSVPAFIDSP